MTQVANETTAIVRSGDVDLFLRHFGQPGRTPALLLGGANYYDSADWVRVASALAGDLEVVTYDYRGYGLSSRSPRQDYSTDAHLGDVTALLDHLGWEQVVLVGHSRGGSLALQYAHLFPGRVAGVALVDFSPGQRTGRAGLEPLSVGADGPIYASLEEAHAATSRNPRELESELGRARVETIFAKRDGGYVNVRRDPAYQHAGPIDQPGWVTSIPRIDLWDALERIARTVPALVVRGLQSRSYDEDALARLRTDLPQVQIADVDSGHDVPGTAPDELVKVLRGFLTG